jgi:opacity protein-like surface antigen
MNRLLLTALIALGLAVSARAAMTAGFTAGYLIDNEEELLTARLGTLFSSTEQVSHIAELEIGFTSISESGVDGDILPLMANYRAQFPGKGSFSGYLGGGIGMSRVKISGFGLSDSDWAFTAQAFAGLSYRLSETSALDFGARYINIQEATVFDFTEEVGDDIAVELGLRVNF